MSRLRLFLPAAIAALVFLWSAAPALARVQSPVADCQAHGGTLTQNYTAKQLRAALGSINSTTREYTTCANAIENQLSQVLGGGHTVTNIDTTGSSGGSSSGTIIIIVVIVVVLLLGCGGAFWAYRRNRGSRPDH